MMQHVKVNEFQHCGHKWESPQERSRCRSCEKMLRPRFVTWVGNIPPLSEYLSKFFLGGDQDAV